jgi:tetratricopeptide (TPR) repeat protein
MRGQRLAAVLFVLILLGCDEKTERAAEADLKEAEAHLKDARWCEGRIALARAQGRLASDKTERAAEADLKEAEGHLKAARWCEARISLARAEGRLASGGPKALRQRVEQMQKDIEMVQRLEAVRLSRVDHKGGAETRYAQAFRSYGLDMTKLKPEEASRQVRASAVREELLPALYEWAMLKPPGPARKELLAIAGAADDDPWRKRLRQAMQEKDGKALTALADDEQTLKQSPAMLLLLARALRQANLSEDAINMLRQAQRRHPNDFWITHDLAELLAQQRTGAAEAVRYYQAALALRPNTPRIHLGLGSALLRLGRVDEAIACYRQAIRLDPRSAPAHLHLGVALQQVGKLAEAIACFRKAIELDPSFAHAYTNLGGAQAATGRIQEAIASFRKSIALDPKNASAHLRLGTTLMRAGQRDEAIACYRQAIQLDPKNAHSYFNLGQALRGKGQLDEAIACYRKALELQPDLKAAKKALEEVTKEKAAK